MAQPAKQPKAMSSRLATMKFMQRASASPSSTPSTPDERPSKKQRLSNGSFNSTPSSTAQREAQSVEDAIAAEAKKREDALEREAADRGESKWYLSYKQPSTPTVETPLRIVSAGYSTLDTTGTRRSDESEEEDAEQTRPKIMGRKSFGKFNRTVEKQQNPDISSSDSEDDDDSESDEEDEDESDDPTGAKAMIHAARKEAGDKARAERKARKQAEKAEALRQADDRRKKHVNLNRLSGISSGGGSGGGGGGSSGVKNITCHACGKKGHIMRECPEQRRGGGGRR